MAYQDRKVYDFASVGTTVTQFTHQTVDKQRGIPIGIATPVQLGYGNAGLLKMSQSIVSQVKDNFRNMLATNWGDRLVLYDFGANLQELAFELTSGVAETEAIRRIKRCAEKYMPFLVLQTFQVVNLPSTSKDNLARIGIRVTYSISGIEGTEVYVDEVTIYAAG